MQSSQNENQASQLPNASSTAEAMEIDGISYDIFRWFPIGYCQDVFKYLSGKDLIQASGVNKEWYKLVAEPKQMKKLKLVFNLTNEEELDDESKNILMNSKRQYENVEIFDDLFSKPGFLLSLLAARAGSWKTVTWMNCSLESGEAWSEMLHALEPTIEELTISPSPYYSGMPVNFNAMTFPHLKSLSSNAFDCDIFKYFARCQTLVKFSCNSLNGDASVILHNNPGLKEVYLENDISPRFDSDDFKFKLQKLKISCFFSELEAEHIYRLLETQADTLESLNINLRLNQAALELILNMPKLLSLALENFQLDDAVLEGREDLPVNMTITSLCLHETFFVLDIGNLDQHETPYQLLIKALPGLKRFSAERIDDGMLLDLAQHAPGLESIAAKNFEVKRIPEGDMFPNIKEFKAEMMDPDLQKPTGEFKFAALVAKAMEPEAEFE